GVAAGLSSATTGGNSLAIASSVGDGMGIAENAVGNNALAPGDVYRAVKDIKQAIKEGKSVDEVYEKYQKLSQKQRAELLADCGIDCRIPTEILLNRATEMAEDYSGFFMGWLVGLPASERERFRALVESENAITNQALDERKGMFEKGIEFGIETAQMFGKEHDLGSTKQNKKSLYDSQKTREKLENEFGKENVKSTTVVLNPRATITNRTLKSGEQVQVITSEGGRAVKVYSKPDQLGERKELANIPYDKQGLPIFDNVSKFTTKIEKPENYQNLSSQTRRNIEMRNATLALKDAIQRGSVNPNQFTKEQLDQINRGLYKIDGFTWHHNKQSGPSNMQLIPTPIHDAVKHVGEGALSEGR
ncbi:HNH endonuclease, partial [Ursidibacter sp. B-7004-1]